MSHVNSAVEFQPQLILFGTFPQIFGNCAFVLFILKTMFFLNVGSILSVFGTGFQLLFWYFIFPTFLKATPSLPEGTKEKGREDMLAPENLSVSFSLLDCLRRFTKVYIFFIMLTFFFFIYYLDYTTNFIPVCFIFLD